MMTPRAPGLVPFDASGFVPLNRLPMSSVRRDPEISLDGDWDFQLLAAPHLPLGEEWGTAQVPGLWTMTEPSDPPHYTNVPMPFDEVPPALPGRNPTGVYHRTVELCASAGRRTVLHVGAAESALRVLVNGEPVGTSSDSHLAAEFDITDATVEGANEIVLVVTKFSAESYLEDQDQWWHGGLPRPVHLVTVPEVRIADIVTVADHDASAGTASLSVEVTTSGLDHLSDVDWTVELEAVGRTVVLPVTPRRATQTLPRPSEDRTTRPEPRLPPDMMDVLSIRAAGAPVPEELRAVAGRMAQTVSHATAAGSVHHVWEGLDVPPWTAETPHLEDVVVRLLDGAGTVVDRTSVRVGFRRVEVVGRDLLVNGRRILVQGVARHDVDPRTGRVMTREGILAELSLMKRSGVNAIRTAHYPNDPVLLDLCDEIGLYVLDEADIEGHAFAGTLADDPRYLPSFLERFSRMVLRDRNHPSVIMWSLGNETGYGAAHDAMAAWSRRTDPTRPVHYEGAIADDWHAGHAATDVVCPMYPSIRALEAFSADERADRPLLACEYAYSQGNSTGGVADYWRAFERLPGLQGGFVWQWRDHSLDPDGDGRYRYGGDFGDEPNGGSTLSNGVVLPDLTPQPALRELRGVFSPVRLESGADEVWAGRLRIRNRQAFAGLHAFVAEVQVETADGPVAATDLLLPDVTPGATAVADLPAAVRTAAGDGALALTVTLRTRADALWAPAGTEVAVVQVDLGAACPTLPTVSVTPSGVTADGTIQDPLLLRAPELCLWRALTDNDRGFALDNRFVRSGFFRLDLTDSLVDQQDDHVVVTRSYRTAFGDEVVHTRRVLTVGGSDHVLHEHVRLPEGTPDGLRVGMELELVEGFEEVQWVGLGPWENYPDRSAGALLGRWRSTVDGLDVPYVHPQENGTRGGVRHLAVTGPAGALVTDHAVPLHMNVSHHTVDDLEAAAHWWELPVRRTTTVHLDVAHRGVGTALLGPDTPRRHRLTGEEYAWQWRLRLHDHDPAHVPARPR